MEYIYKKLTIEIDKDNSIVLVAKQGDVKSRYVNLFITYNRKPYDLTGVNVRVYATKPDNTTIYNDLTVISATNGELLMELTSQMLLLQGILICELQILGANNEVLSTRFFNIKVVATTIDETAIVSSNEFTALTSALASIEQAVSNITTIENLHNVIQNDITQAQGIVPLYSTTESSAVLASAYQYFKGSNMNVGDKAVFELVIYSDEGYWIGKAYFVYGTGIVFIEQGSDVTTIYGNEYGTIGFGTTNTNIIFNLRLVC